MDVQVRVHVHTCSALRTVAPRLISFLFGASAPEVLVEPDYIRMSCISVGLVSHISPWRLELRTYQHESQVLLTYTTCHMGTWR